jgi:predicted nucleotidyltransferase
MTDHFGLRPDIIERIRGVFARFPAVERVVLYGSRARGDERYNSDFDFLVQGEELEFSAWTAISRAIDDLMLPWKVDLVLDKMLRHTGMRANIEREGVEFYRRAKDPQ